VAKPDCQIAIFAAREVVMDNTHYEMICYYRCRSFRKRALGP
jgi:hypothetical protein